MGCSEKNQKKRAKKMTVRELLKTVKDTNIAIDGYLGVHFCEEAYNYKSDVFEENVAAAYVENDVLHIVPEESSSVFDARITNGEMQRRSR